MAKERYTAEEVAAAIRKAQGFLTPAAEALGCSVHTVIAYANRYATVKAAQKEAKYKRDDFVESRIMQGIKDGNPSLIIFYAKTQMKDRGYTEKNELHLTDWQSDIVAALRDGRITPADVRAAYPDLATQFFAQAGINATVTTDSD